MLNSFQLIQKKYVTKKNIGNMNLKKKVSSSMSEYIKEVVWIPLDGQDKLIIAPGCDPAPNIE